MQIYLRFYQINAACKVIMGLDHIDDGFKIHIKRVFVFELSGLHYLLRSVRMQDAIIRMGNVSQIYFHIWHLNNILHMPDVFCYGRTHFLKVWKKQNIGDIVADTVLQRTRTPQLVVCLWDITTRKTHNGPFVRGNHRSPMNSSLTFCLLLAWTRCWKNSYEAGEIRHPRPHATSP